MIWVSKRRPFIRPTTRSCTRISVQPASLTKRPLAQDRLVTGMGSTPWPEFLKKSPLPEKLQQEIARLYDEKKDYLSGLSKEEKHARLAKISYAGFLTEICKADPGVLPFFQSYTTRLVCSRN